MLTTKYCKGGNIIHVVLRYPSILFCLAPPFSIFNNIPDVGMVSLWLLAFEINQQELNYICC